MQKCCDLLNINRSSIYYQQVLPEDDDVLCNRISEIYQEFPCYGYRKVTAVLRHKELPINHKRVQRLMQDMGIQAIYPKPKLSQPNRANSVFPYLLGGLAILRPNQVWAVDITYIKLPLGMAYLFALIDWYSRFIVGWQLANSMSADHGLAALESSLAFGKPDICNADQGSQFTGNNWVKTLQSLGIQVSHDGVGRCIDNVRIERFWRTIKYEDLYLRQYRDLVEARIGIAKFITHYNYHRPHQALKYARPADYFYSK